MSRNSETVFTDLPQVNIPRSIFDIPQDIKTTFNVGELIPFYVNECIPGSSVKIQTSKVVRLQTLLTPLMDPMYLDTYYFFVPARLVFDKWKEFMGENTASAYLPQVEYTIPQLTIGGTGGAVVTGDILDYMGVPIRSQAGFSFGISELPARAYTMIWNEFFRDQNLQNPVNVSYGVQSHNWSAFPVHDPLPVNRYHDYFSSALIAPAKTPDGFVTAWTTRKRTISGSPLSGTTKAPVYAGDTLFSDVSGQPLRGSYVGSSTVDVRMTASALPTSSSDTPNTTLTTNVSGPTGFHPLNLYADLAYNQFGISIPNLRQAFQMQKFLERDASHGTRYQEQLFAHFGVKAQDSRLQRPEYLGGNRIPLNISQIVNQASSSGEFLGDVGGMSLTTDSHFDVEYSIQEHGYIIGLMCCRYKNSYSQGIERFWLKREKFDFAFPEFAHLTDQPVVSAEIYLPLTDTDYPNSVFGYQERYAEYKFKPNKVTGQMRPGITGSLAAWHLGDYYTDNVYLSDSWLQVDKANVDRALTVSSAVADQLFADIVVNARWTLPLPVHSNPGFADHF